MAKVALPLCLLFIIIALRHDIKEYPRFSKSLWFSFLWLGMTASRPFTVWLFPSRSGGGADYITDYIQGNPIERAILAGFICIAIIILLKRKHKFSFNFRDNSWLIVLYFYALMSISWSDFPAVAIRRYIKVAGDILMTLIILSEDDRRKTIEHVLRRLAIILIPLSVLIVNTNLGINGLRVWGGVTTGKNELGILCAFLGVFLVWRILQVLPRLNMYDIILLVFIIYLLNGANSATSNVLFISGVLLCVGMNILKKYPHRINSIITIFIVLSIFLQIFFTIYSDFSLGGVFFSATGRDASFTGRTVLWSTLIAIGSQSPIFGTGYSSFWLGNMTKLAEKFEFRPNQAHNGYLEVFLNLGIIGLILLVIVLLKTFKRLRFSPGRTGPIDNLFFIFLLMIILHNVTEATIMMPTYFISIVFLLISIVVTNVNADPLAQGQDEAYNGLVDSGQKESHF